MESKLSASESRLSELLGVAGLSVSLGAGLVAPALGFIVFGILLGCWSILFFSTVESPLAAKSDDDESDDE